MGPGGGEEDVEPLRTARESHTGSEGSGKKERNMFSLRKMALVVGAVVGLAAHSSQAGYVDTFNTGLTNLTTDLSTSPNGASELTGVFGGERQISVSVTGGGDAEARTKVNVAASGSASLGSDPGTDAVWTFTYDGPGSTGLGGVDFSDPSISIDFVFTSVNVGATLGLTLVDLANASHTASQVVSTAGTYSFALASYGSFIDLTKINSLSFTVTGGTDGDYRIDEVQIVPVPAALTAGLALLGGCAFFGRRRQVA